MGSPCHDRRLPEDRLYPLAQVAKVEGGTPKARAASANV